MKRTHRLLLPALVLAVGLFAGCGDEIEPGHTAPGSPKTVSAPVDTTKVQSRPFLYEAVATINARTASTLSGKLMGTVSEVRVAEGAVVEQGDILVVLDQRQVAAQYDQARAGVKEARRAEASARSAREAAKAAADLARTTYERYRQLLRENSVSRQEFDEVAARHRQAQATLTQTTAMLEAAGHRVQQATAALESAQVSKKDAVVRAPYSGRITAKMIEVGDLASPGTPFFTIEKTGVYCADLVLPESHIDAISIDEKVSVKIPALQGKEMVGQIGRIVPSADQRSRTFLVKVALPEDPALRSGLFARVMIPVGEAGMMTVPDSAVIRRGQLTGVYLLGDDGLAKFRLIRTGKRMGDRVEVISGLKEGERYVTTPPPAMADGVRVEVSS